MSSSLNRIKKNIIEAIKKDNDCVGVFTYITDGTLV